MMIAAVAGVPSDFAELQVRAVKVERNRVLPSQFQVVTETLLFFCEAASAWESLDEPSRDLLRRVAHSVGDRPKVSWFGKQRAAFQLARLVRRHGVDETIRQAHALVNACDRFRSIVLECEERHNETLQSALAEAIDSSLTAQPTRKLSRGQVGEWIRQLPR
jgi:hypothetical protein